MKFLLITSTNSLNIGNDFINNGCELVIKKLFPDITLEKLEALDTVSDNQITYLPMYKNYLNSFDVIFVACGSLISNGGIVAIRNILKLKPKKIFLGIGRFQYNKEEIEYCKQIEKHKNTYFFTRDNLTYKAFTNKNKNIFYGIDFALFLSDFVHPIKVKEKYCVINIDSISDNIQVIKENIKYFEKLYKKVYVVENTTARYKITELKNNYIYYSNWEGLYKLFQTASLVKTNRIHTIVACVINNVPFIFTWTYPDMTNRKDLFTRVGVLLERDKISDSNQVEKVNIHKNKFLKLLEKTLKTIIYI